MGDLLTVNPVPVNALAFGSLTIKIKPETQI